MKSLCRWLILSQYYPPEIGAAQTRLQSVARELQRRGFQVEVLTAMPNYPAGKVFPSYAGRWYMREEIDGIAIRRTWIYAGSGKSAFVRLANYLSFTLSALVRALAGRAPDVMFVESQPLSLGLIAVLMKWIRRVPYIYNVPDLQIDAAEQLGFIRNRMFLRLALALENFFLRQSWKVSTVTHRFVEHFQSRGLPCSQITFLPNGADTEVLKPQPPCEALWDRWGLRGKKVFLYVGTHAYYHGLDTLIEAAALLRNDPDIAILMIGDGPERERLKRMAAERGLANVIFGPPCGQLGPLYSIAYASVATLRNMEVAEGMRLAKIFPSLSCAVPVIFAGRGETARLLSSNKCGMVVPPEDPASLAEAIRRLVLNPSMREEMGKMGRDLVKAEYSWPILVERWLNEIRDSRQGVSAELYRLRQPLVPDRPLSSCEGLRKGASTLGDV